MSDEDRGRDLLVRGVAAAKAGSKDEARFFLQRVLQQDVSIASRVKAWRYLSELADDPAEKRRYLGQILAADPVDGLARRELAILDGRLDPRELVDPNRIPPASPHAVETTGGPALTCRRCGSSKIVLAPGGQTLVCEHCHSEERLDAAGPRGIDDHDFIATLWTAKGHRAPVATKCFTCRSCGASFAIAPDALSFTCAYCGSVHVDEPPTTADLLRPDALITFDVTEHAAQHAAREWQANEGFREPMQGLVGVYVPFWALSFGGEVRWRGVERSSRDSAPEHVSGSRAILGIRAVVCAGDRLPDTVRDATDQFDFQQLIPYDPRHLAGWAAETYQVTLEQAATRARRIAIDRIRAEMSDDLESVADVEISSAGLAIDTFTLVLLPFWIVRVNGPDALRIIVINGQSGAVRGDVRPEGLLAWLARLSSTGGNP